MPVKTLAGTSLLVLAFLSSCAAPAFAADKETCVRAHASGQRARRAGGFRAARASFLACATDECPAVIQRECSEWLAEVEATQPTILVAARTASGQDLADVKVYLDAALIAERLAGVALEVDPGEHVVRVVAPNGAAVEERVVLQEGEKRREVAVTVPEAAGEAAATSPPNPFAPSPADEKPSSSGRGLPVPAYVLGGVALLGFGGFATFGLLASSKADSLDKCQPYCDRGEADAMRTQALVADVSLAVAIAASIGAIVVVATRPASLSRSR